MHHVVFGLLSLAGAGAAAAQGGVAHAHIEVVPAHDDDTAAPLIGGLNYISPPGPEVTLAPSAVQGYDVEYEAPWTSIAEEEGHYPVPDGGHYYSDEPAPQEGQQEQQWAEYYPEYPQQQQQQGLEGEEEGSNYQYYDNTVDDYQYAQEQQYTAPAQEQQQQEPISDEDLQPSFSGFIKFLKRKFITPLTSPRSSAASAANNHHFSEKQDSEQELSISERVLETATTVGSYLTPFESPVANWVLGFTAVGLLTQGLIRPYGAVTIADDSAGRRSNDAAPEFNAMKIIEWMAVFREMYDSFDPNDLECQKRLICDVVKNEAYYGAGASKLKSGFRAAKFLEYVSLPDDIRELVDEYLDANARAEQDKDCSEYFQCPFSINDSAKRNLNQL